jgi:mannose-6-phosphate isomerase-like protein (cupin superfamily)
MKKQAKLWVLGHKINPIEVSGNYDMVIGETAPNVPGPPPHFHAKTNELFMVLEGEMEFIIDGNPITVNKGESVDLPPNSVHTFKNDGNIACQWVNIHSPKGFLSFFEDMGVAQDESDAFQKSVSDDIIQKVMKEAVLYDMHIKM